MKKTVIILTFLLLAGLHPFSASGAGQFNIRKPEIADKDLVINIKDISEYALFYPVSIDGFKMEVIAVKAPDKTIRTVFNACEVCYNLGKGYYVQKRSVLICQQCGDQFTIDNVEIVQGDCNPIPIFPNHKTVTASTITISLEYLKEAKIMFEQKKQ
jgi:uncharacterized membrane protein